MLATYLNSLIEAFNHRVALVMLGVALLTAGLMSLIVRVRSAPDGSETIVVGSLDRGPVATAVPEILQQQIGVLANLLPLLAIFAAVPLLVMTLEKGWLELTFSKGVSRWKVFLGRFLGGVTLFACTFLLSALPLAYRLWWQTYVPTWQVVVALILETFSFTAVLAVAALATLAQKGVALPIVASVSVWLLSSTLADRRNSYYLWFTSPIARAFIEWTYRVFPKCHEISRLSAFYIQKSYVASWWPLWSTGAFIAVVLGLTLWLLHKKSF